LVAKVQTFFQPANNSGESCDFFATFARITSICKVETNLFLRSEHTSIMNYNFTDFFYIIKYVIAMVSYKAANKLRPFQFCSQRREAQLASMFFPVKELLIYFPLQDYRFRTFLRFLTNHILHLFEIFEIANR